MPHVLDPRRVRTHAWWTLLAAGLAACSADSPSAPHARADRTTPSPAAAVDAAPEPGGTTAGFVSNRFAYVWADQPTTASYTPTSSYAYNATGGGTHITRVSPGTYEVAFDSPSGWAGSPVGFAVSAYGSSTLGCTLQYNSPGTQLVVSVVCFDRVAHVRADSRFTLLVVGKGSLLSRSAFAFADQPSAPSYNPHVFASYTSGPGPILITHGASTGSYTVDMGIGTSSHSTFLVSEQFFFPGYVCTGGHWNAASVEVLCFDEAGNPNDRYYWALQVDGGRPGRRLGFAWASQPKSPSYTPVPLRSFNSSGGTIRISRSSTGRYVVVFGGLQKLPGRTENVQVTPTGPRYSTCNVVNWGNAANGLRVLVECRRVNGAFADTPFNVLVIE